MAVTLNASTSSGFIATSDTSGSLELQANGTTKATVGSTGLSIGQYNPAASLITSATAQSANTTNIDFTGIPSWVKRITVMFQGVSSNGSNNYLIQLGTGATPTYTTSGYLGTSTVMSAGVGSANMSTGFLLNQSSQGAGCVFHGLITICLLGSNNWVAMGYCGESDAARGWTVGGSVSLGAALTAVRIAAGGADAFDAGTINILYE